VNQSDAAKVLIVDDDAGQRSAMGQLLGSWGYQVLTACDGRDALDKLTDFRPTPS
jgi:CheY-like chemotaxis protein